MTAATAASYASKPITYSDLLHHGQWSDTTGKESRQTHRNTNVNLFSNNQIIIQSRSVKQTGAEVIWAVNDMYLFFG